MKELSSNNGKTRKTEDVARGNENCNPESNPRGMGAVTSSCSRLGTEIEISIDRAVSQIEYNPTRLTISDQIIGGILRQLIGQARDQQARLKGQIQELDSQVNEWNKLLESLEQTLTESESQD